MIQTIIFYELILQKALLEIGNFGRDNRRSLRLINLAHFIRCVSGFNRRSNLFQHFDVGYGRRFRAKSCNPSSPNLSFKPSLIAVIRPC